MKKLFVLIAIAFVFTSFQVAEATIIYQNDFQSAVLTGWSSTGGPVTISTAPNGYQFLGRDSYYGFSNETVSLSLSGIPVPNIGVTLAFDLYIIQSWDGNSTNNDGPDFFTLSVSGGSTLLYTTFASPLTGSYQSYPGNYDPYATYVGGTGATAINALGYPPWGDAIYHLAYTFPHSNSDLIINFAASNLQVYYDEGWGIDNVIISTEGSVIPEPNTILLLGSGLFGIGLLGIIKKRKS